MNKKLPLIFICAFIFNWIWETLHSRFYLHYQGGEITRWILFRAAIFDAAFITLLGLAFLKIDYLRKRPWLSLVFGFIAAVLIEWYALQTGRWGYKEMMPIIPFLNTGLTPTIQLGILSYFILKIVDRRRT